MSYRTRRGRAAGKHVKKIEWTETPLTMSAPSTSRAAYVRRARKNYRIGGLMRAKGEMKAVDVYTGSLVADTTGTLSLLNGIARGDDIDERDGREVIMKSIQINGLNAVTSGTGVDQTHRVILVYDKQANAAACTGAQVLDTTAANITLAVRNLENRKRFVILMDKVFRLSASGESNSSVAWRYYKRFNLPVTFNTGTAGTIADIVTGSLYLFSFGNIAAGATAGTLVVNCRIRYSDK